MLEGKTKSGFKFKIDESILDDWSVFTAIADMDSGDASKVLRGTVAYVNLVLGDKAKDLEEHIRKKNGGRCPSSLITAEVTEIMNSAKELKNSSTSSDT